MQCDDNLTRLTVHVGELKHYCVQHEISKSMIEKTKKIIGDVIKVDNNSRA